MPALRRHPPHVEPTASELLTRGPLLGPRTGRVAAARRLLRRSVRHDTGRLLVEGPAALSAAAAAGRVVEVFATPDAAQRHDTLLDELMQGGCRCSLVDDAAAAALSETVTPQGLVGVVTLPAATLEDLPAAPRLVAVLLEARDPGNAGTIIRTADAAGADAVILAGASVDPRGGKCVRASAGSVFNLPVIDAVELTDVLDALSGRGCRVLAADGYGTADLDDEIDAGRLAEPTAWLFGNEARGLPGAAVRAAAAAVAVPVYGAAESLNLAAAAAVCLYASARAQHHEPGAGSSRARAERQDR